MDTQLNVDLDLDGRPVPVGTAHFTRYLDHAAAIVDQSVTRNRPRITVASHGAVQRNFATSMTISVTTGFLHSPGGWALAPAFDVNPNPDPNKSRATSINGTSTTHEEIDALHEAARYCGISSDTAASLITHIRSAASQWRSLALRNGIAEHQLRLFADVLPAA